MKYTQLEATARALVAKGKVYCRGKRYCLVRI
jgi:hypothetical protein